jgi:sensor histidine kinase YesM
MVETRRSGWRDWGGLGIIIIAAALFAMVVGGYSPSSRFADLLEGFLIAALFSACITGWIVLIIPRLMAPAVWSRLAFPLNWAVLVSTLVAIAVAGSLTATVMLALLGYIPFDRVLGVWRENSLRVSLIVTLTFGLFIFAQEVVRGRLNEATLALRTKERDEAEARRMATEARLTSLESRVHPHFLFNTLNSIASLIPSDPAGAERMTTQLASLLRSSLDHESAPLVPLAREIAHVRDYLAIERVRLGDRLRFDIDVPEGVAHFSVPRLALQTLTENSVKHVIASRREGGHIHLTAVQEGSQLVLRVADSGLGFTEHQITAGHGLALLRERLDMQYGSNARLETSRSHDGAAVTLRVPTSGGHTTA